MKRSRVLAGLFTTAGLALVASCGSRTGLFGADAFVGFEGGVDAPADAFVPDVKDAAEEDVIEEDAAVACLPGTFPFTVATAQLMFVIDRSGSMEQTLDGQTSPSLPHRWETLQAALAQTIPAFDQQMAMGAKFFPAAPLFVGPPLGCQMDPGVDITPALGNAQRILDVFDDTAPNGGTPTTDALTNAAAALTTSRATSRAIILATDGEPNCNAKLDQNTCVCTLQSNQPCATNPDGTNCLDIDRTTATITDIANNAKIPVYVLGIVNPNNAPLIALLDQMAVAGGRPLPPQPGKPRSYNVQSLTDMTVAFNAIANSVAKCTYLTPSAPKDPTKIKVQINGSTVAPDPANGWDWVDQSYGELEFSGDACIAAQQPGAAVSGVISCDTP